MAKMDDWVVPVVLGAGALGALYLATRNKDEGGAGLEAQAGGGSGSDSPFAEEPGSLSFFDPATGLPVSPADVGFTDVAGTGLPGTVTDPGGSGFPESPTTINPQFSPDFERQLLQQNEDVNRQIVEEQRRQTRADQLAGAATVGLLGLAAAPAAIKIASKTPALFRVAAPVAARGATAAVRVAGPVGAGIGLGLAGVAALDKAGALDQVQKFGQSTIGKAPQPVQAYVKTVALPLSTIGAVATAAVGRGSVQENVRSAFRGTYVDSGVKAVQGFFGWR